MKRWLITLCLIAKLGGLGLLLLTSHTLIGWVLFVGGMLGITGHIALPSWQGFVPTITRFSPNGEPVVWLTIDDGPDPEDTPRILELLMQYNAKATFFLIGERAARYPELVAAIRAAGHEIGCHTHTHPSSRFWLLGPRALAAQIDDACAAIGGEITLFRSPAGIKSFFLARCLKQRGLRYLSWTLRSGDGVGRNLAAITGRVSRGCSPGMILLMHEGPSVAPSVRVQAIHDVLADLTAQGYHFIRPSEEQLQVSHKQISITPPTTEEPLCN